MHINMCISTMQVRYANPIFIAEMQIRYAQPILKSLISLEFTVVHVIVTKSVRGCAFGKSPKVQLVVFNEDKDCWCVGVSVSEEWVRGG